MSNSRIFCFGFVANCVAFSLFELLGGDGPLSGLSEVIANFILAAGWGIGAVALFGDRGINEEPKNG